MRAPPPCHRPRVLEPLLALALAVGASGCQREDEVLRTEVQRLTLAEGQAALKEAERVASRGRRALPFIEAALHTSDEPGRKNLVVAMRRLGDVEAVPLLLHLSAYDPAPSVQREAEWTLREWARAEPPDDRGQRARAAIRRMEELKGREAAG